MSKVVAQYDLSKKTRRYILEFHAPGYGWLDLEGFHWLWTAKLTAILHRAATGSPTRIIDKEEA